MQSAKSFHTHPHTLDAYRLPWIPSPPDMTTAPVLVLVLAVVLENSIGPVNVFAPESDATTMGLLPSSKPYAIYLPRYLNPHPAVYGYDLGVDYGSLETPPVGPFPLPERTHYLVRVHGYVLLLHLRKRTVRSTCQRRSGGVFPVHVRQCEPGHCYLKAPALLGSYVESGGVGVYAYDTPLHVLGAGSVGLTVEHIASAVPENGTIGYLYAVDHVVPYSVVYGVAYDLALHAHTSKGKVRTVCVVALHDHRRSGRYVVLRYVVVVSGGRGPGPITETLFGHAGAARTLGEFVYACERLLVHICRSRHIIGRQRSVAGTGGSFKVHTVSPPP